MMAKKHKSIRLLLTCSQSLITLGRAEQLKANPDYDFHLIGVDTLGDGYKLPLLDKQYKVPSGLDKDYVEAIECLAKREKIDVIVPSSDNEVLAVARQLNRFKRLGVACVCSAPEVIKTSINKADMLLFLKKAGIPVPKFAVPSSLDQVASLARHLGYPKKTVVLKPAWSGGGNRGVWFMQSDFSRELTTTKGTPLVTLEALIEQLKKLSSFPRLVLMEYLLGEEYSVDGLAEQGKPVYVVPRVRVAPLPGFSREGLIRTNPAVSRYVSRIATAFGFDSNFNVQLKYDSNGKPLVYEINPRVSATVAANAAAGIDLFLFGILQALGLPYPKDLQFTPTRMVRFSKEFYAKP